MKLLLLFVLISCASIKEKKAIESSWQNKSLAELDHHDYFSKISFSGDQNHRRYVRRGHHQSKASCAIIDCRILGEGDCYHEFEIRDQIIVSYRRSGDCRKDEGLN